MNEYPAGIANEKVDVVSGKNARSYVIDVTLVEMQAYKHTRFVVNEFISSVIPVTKARIQ